MDPDLEIVFQGFRRDLFITDEEWERITGVVTLHLALDSFLFVILTLKLAALVDSPKAFSGVGEYMGRMRFAQRLDLAKRAGWIDADTAGHAGAVNTVRNKLVHYRNKAKDVPEIATEAAFHALVARGLRAYGAMVAIVKPHLPQSAQP
jgi:hypothetical protein